MRTPIHLGMTLLLAMTTTTACASFSSLRSETSIDAGQSFLLGGDQGGAYDATVTNVGSVPVGVFLETGGVRRRVIELAPDSTIEAVIEPRNMVVFENASRQRAVLKIVAKGARDLGMRYRPVTVPSTARAATRRQELRLRLSVPVRCVGVGGWCMRLPTL
jgi:hypothetical protein